ncbi:hypothetical protein AAH986_14840, partial [Enterococcus lactis]
MFILWQKATLFRDKDVGINMVMDMLIIPKIGEYHKKFIKITILKKKKTDICENHLILQSFFVHNSYDFRSSSN